jgi:hypothetical protein
MPSDSAGHRREISADTLTDSDTTPSLVPGIGLPPRGCHLHELCRRRSGATDQTAVPGPITAFTSMLGFGTRR